MFKVNGVELNLELIRNEFSDRSQGGLITKNDLKDIMRSRKLQPYLNKISMFSTIPIDFTYFDVDSLSKDLQTKCVNINYISELTKFATVEAIDEYIDTIMDSGMEDKNIEHLCKIAKKIFNHDDNYNYRDNPKIKDYELFFRDIKPQEMKHIIKNLLADLTIKTSVEDIIRKAITFDNSINGPAEVPVGMVNLGTVFKALNFEYLVTDLYFVIYDEAVFNIDLFSKLIQYGTHSIYEINDIAVPYMLEDLNIYDNLIDTYITGDYNEDARSWQTAKYSTLLLQYILKYIIKLSQPYVDQTETVKMWENDKNVEAFSTFIVKYLLKLTPENRVNFIKDWKSNETIQKFIEHISTSYLSNFKSDKFMLELSELLLTYILNMTLDLEYTDEDIEDWEENRYIAEFSEYVSTYLTNMTELLLKVIVMEIQKFIYISQMRDTATRSQFKHYTGIQTTKALLLVGYALFAKKDEIVYSYDENGNEIENRSTKCESDINQLYKMNLESRR